MKENSLKIMRGETLVLKRARVMNEERERYMIELGNELIPAVLSGKFRYQAVDRSDYPSVGDYVLVDSNFGEDISSIEKIEERKSCLVRKLAGEYAGEQVLGTNIDTVFLLNSLNRDLNLRRIERYLVMIEDGGITPVIVLTKSDLVTTETAEDLKKEVETIAGGKKVFLTSIKDKESLESLKLLINPGDTVALLGSSGVGKSSLTNYFLGVAFQKIEEIGEHAERGKHTTTSRSLFKLQNGAYLMDTPGIREIQLWEGEGGVENAFSDILSLMNKCRFSNCRHGDDMGCAVQEALVEGTLDEKRLRSFLKIEREQAYMKARSTAKTSRHKKEVWKKRSKVYRRGKRGREI